jgi:hypothetical protein
MRNSNLEKGQSAYNLTGRSVGTGFCLKGLAGAISSALGFLAGLVLLLEPSRFLLPDIGEGNTSSRINIQMSCSLILNFSSVVDTNFMLKCAAYAIAVSKASCRNSPILN